MPESSASSPLQSLADAAIDYRRAEVATLRASEIKLGVLWSLVTLVMKIWAGVFFAGGILMCAFALVMWGQGMPAFVLKRDESSFQATGWTLGLGLGAFFLLLSKFQSWLAARLRARKLREARGALGFTETSPSSPSPSPSLPR